MCNFEYTPQYIALAQLHSAFNEGLIIPQNLKLFLNKLMKQGLDVDYAIPLDAPVAQHAPELVGCTALHFAARARNKEAVDYFIQHGAKVTATNNLACSPLLFALDFDGITALSDTKYRTLDQIERIVKGPVVKSLLKAQYDQNDTSNPAGAGKMAGLSHLHIACMVNDARMVKFLSEYAASADAMISADSFYMAGFRPLHVAVRYRAVDSLKQLLSSGADLWAREARGLTPLQLLIDCNLQLAHLANLSGCDNNSDSFENYYLDNDQMVNLILAHYSADDSLQDECGLDRLHIAASMRDHTILLDTLKANPKVNVNAGISENSPHWPGYTPLHFAARCGFNAVKLLAERGANLFNTDACGITPIDICATIYEPAILYEIMKFDEKMKSVTFKTSSLATLCDAVNALQSTDHLETFLSKMSSVNDPVSLESPLWPGYTLLHLAVALGPHQVDYCLFKKLLYNCELGVTDYNWRRSMLSRKQEAEIHDRLEILKYLEKNRANPIAQDVRNSSPVHLAFRQGNDKVVKYLLNQLVGTFNQLDNVSDVTDLDGLSLLHIVAVLGLGHLQNLPLRTNADVNVRTKSALKLRNRENREIYLSPSSTPLHFAAAFDSHLIESLVQQGADPLAINADGLTPVLLTFIYNDTDSILDLSVSAAEILLSTPSALKTNVVGIAGLSHLHIACRFDMATTVKSFLNLGADVNARINCRLNDSYAECPSARVFKLLLKKYEGYTPLHFAVQFGSLAVIALLIKSGADLHARNAYGLSPLHIPLVCEPTHTKEILKCLLERIDNTNCKPIDDFGITLLHIACLQQDTGWVKRLLLTGADINAQIAVHSPIWPGDTPLHIVSNGLLDGLHEGFSLTSLNFAMGRLALIKLLIAHGADITLPNVDKVTALQAVTDLFGRSRWKLHYRDLGIKLNCCDVNQMNKEGLSFIHTACKGNDMETVTELLTGGADVNWPIDYFAKHMGGCGPLHFAAMISSPKMVQLLIEKGANVNAKDCHGSTPLHAFCQYGVGLETNSNVSVILTLCTHGADVNSRDVRRMTPLELLLQRCWNRQTLEQSLLNLITVNAIVDEEISCLLSCGARLNSLNNEKSLLATFVMATESGKLSPDALCNASNTDILAVMDDGSTAIHNSVRCYTCDSSNLLKYLYTNVIDKLLKRGCSINAQDNHGRTALHVAVEHNNYWGVHNLLEAGINPNIADNQGNNYWGVRCSLNDDTNLIIEYDGYEQKDMKPSINKILHSHLCKFILLGLEISESNRRLYEEYEEQQQQQQQQEHQLSALKKELKLLRELKPIAGFSLCEILSERTLGKYASMSRAHREVIIQILASPKLYEQFPLFSGPIRYQYRRLLERMDLIEPTKNLLRIILGMPESCLDRIISFLNNEDLKMLTRDCSDNEQ